MHARAYECPRVGNSTATPFPGKTSCREQGTSSHSALTAKTPSQVVLGFSPSAWPLLLQASGQLKQRKLLVQTNRIQLLGPWKLDAGCRRAVDSKSFEK